MLILENAINQTPCVSSWKVLNSLRMKWGNRQRISFPIRHFKASRCMAQIIQFNDQTQQQFYYQKVSHAEMINNCKHETHRIWEDRWRSRKAGRRSQHNESTRPGTSSGAGRPAAGAPRCGTMTGRWTFSGNRSGGRTPTDQRTDRAWGIGGSSQPAAPKEQWDRPRQGQSIAVSVTSISGSGAVDIYECQLRERKKNKFCLLRCLQRQLVWHGAQRSSL